MFWCTGATCMYIPSYMCFRFYVLCFGVQVLHVCIYHLTCALDFMCYGLVYRCYMCMCYMCTLRATSLYMCFWPNAFDWIFLTAGVFDSFAGFLQNLPRRKMATQGSVYDDMEGTFVVVAFSIWLLRGSLGMCSSTLRNAFCRVRTLCVSPWFLILFHYPAT